MKKQNLAYIFALLSVMFWSTVATAFKISLLYFDYIQLLFYATLVSLIFLFITLIFQKKIYLLRQLKRNDYIHSALLGFLNPFLYYTILFKAYSVSSFYYRAL